MSAVSKLVEELRGMEKSDSEYCEWKKKEILKEAADTIESIFAKMQAENTNQSKENYQECEKLKLCPFCGGLAKTIETYCEESGYHGFYITHNCDVLGIINTSSFDKKEEAIKKWNKRTELIKSV